MAVKGGLSRKKTIREVLLEKKLLEDGKLAQADDDSKKNNKSFQQAVVDLGLLPKGRLLKILSEDWGVKAVDLSQMEIDKDIAKLLPEGVARRHIAVPFAKEESVLFVAMADPRDFFISEDIHLRTGLEIQGYLAMPGDIVAALDGAYGKSDAAAKLIADVVKKEQEAAEKGGSDLQLANKQEVKSDIAEVDASAPEVEKLVNAIMIGALDIKASDIHIEPYEDPNGKNSKIQIRYRVDGMLRKAAFDAPWAYRNAISAKIKIMTGSMNITERRIPQSGRIQVLMKGAPIEFRVEIVPTVYGESCVMRILDRASVRVDIKVMGFLPDTEEKLLAQFQGIGGKKNFGLMIVCGPTGSGKSTTLYGCLNYVNRPDIKILTAENPVEYNIDGIVQVPVNPDIKLAGGQSFNFALALRSFLRLDPDVIMVGEIRDEETAHIAMEAAMTGHLVFSTLHTNDAASALERLIQMGLPAFMVANTMKSVLAQRLARRLCKDCKEEVPIAVDELGVFKHYGINVPEGAKLFKAVGCKNCKDIGYRGRVGMHELLVLSDPIREQLLKDPSAIPVKNMALKDGMRTIIQDGLEKVLLGQTTVREVLGGTTEEKKEEGK
jgi:type IV pilus assembly protein PilB